jgi:hypothetical protein
MSRKAVHADPSEEAEVVTYPYPSVWRWPSARDNEQDRIEGDDVGVRKRAPTGDGEPPGSGA